MIYYAEDSDGNIVHIDIAIKGVTYYFRHEDKEYEIIVAHGEKYRKHYKTKRGEDIDNNIIFHYNCQKYIKENKLVIVDDLQIQAYEVLLEAEAARYIKTKIPEYSMRPDCLFLDSDRELLCIVEVFVTHRKSNEDIEKIKQYKIPTIELTYGKAKDNYQEYRRAEWLYFYTEDEYKKHCRERITNGNNTIYEQQREITGIKNDIEHITDATDNYSLEQRITNQINKTNYDINNTKMILYLLKKKLNILLPVFSSYWYNSTRQEKWETHIKQK